MHKVYENISTMDKRALNIMYGDRQYHNIQHAENVYSYCMDIIKRYGNIKERCDDHLVFSLAALYHDCVYDPFASPGKNENSSYQNFTESEAFLDHEYTGEWDWNVVKCVEECILATSNHWEKPATELPGYVNVFLDADIYELGAPWELFWYNTTQLYHEAKSANYDLTYTEFTSKRKGWCAKLLEQPKIFKIATHLEDKARWNLERSCKAL